MNVKLGVKGFNSELKCRGLQYRIGQIQSEDVKPRICGAGMHYCDIIKDVFKYYPNNGKNRFCVVEVLGDVEEGVDKSATNKLKIIRELTKEELLNGVSQEQLVKNLKAFNDDGFIIGGSYALKAHGYNINRPISDIDIVTTEEDTNAVLEKLQGMAKTKHFSSRDSIASCTGIYGEKYDVIRNANAHGVVRKIHGVDVIVQDDIEIWEAKLRYALHGVKKHMDDILHNNVCFEMSPRNKLPEDYNLPF